MFGGGSTQQDVQVSVVEDFVIMGFFAQAPKSVISELCQKHHLGGLADHKRGA